MAEIILPGELLPQDHLTTNDKTSKSLALGTGVHFRYPSTLIALNAGTVSIDQRKRSVWIDGNGSGRYRPTVGDQVIATVHHSSADLYHCSIVPYSIHATLGHMAFEGVTRKTRPVLQSGDLVYARVSRAEKHIEPELECVRPTTGKADGLGELKGGTVFDVSLGFARRLLLSKPRDDGNICVLEDLGSRGLSFEIAIGRSGRVWVNSSGTATTIAIGRILGEVDRKNLNLREQEQLVKQVMRSTPGRSG